MAEADVKVIRILRALKAGTRKGEHEWSPAGVGYLHTGESFSATIESDEPSGNGPFRLQILDRFGEVTNELSENDDDPPGMEGDWRDELSALFTLAGRKNPKKSQHLDMVLQELGADVDGF